MSLLSFPKPEADQFRELREEVREFLRAEIGERPVAKRAESWTAFDPEFSRELGKRGWIGMTWPKTYGGSERSSLERYVVQEELLAAGAPVAAHWIADRQSGPLLLKFGNEEQRKSFLPRIAAGECYFCIGMSEPDSGSDLAAARTRAEPVEGGYRVNGTKIWTSHGHEVDYMILFCKTGGSEDRHGGASQFIIDLKSPGITVRPIRILTGEQHFNEVVFEDVFVPSDSLVGEEGNGWAQVMSELAFERSGPERFLSAFPLFAAAIDELQSEQASDVGRMTARLIVLRHLSRSLAGVLQQGGDPTLEASIVKDVGTQLEQDLPELVRKHLDIDEISVDRPELAAAYAATLAHSPSFTLRGGTTEILRGIVARGLGLR